MLVERGETTELERTGTGTGRQITACKQHAGAARWASPWGQRIRGSADPRITGEA